MAFKLFIDREKKSLRVIRTIMLVLLAVVLVVASWMIFL